MTHGKNIEKMGIKRTCLIQHLYREDKISVLKGFKCIKS